jgi:hypothetical protein
MPDADIEIFPNTLSLDARLTKVEARIADMEAQNNQCISMLEDILATLTRADNTISQVAKEVMPTIESLMTHPLLKAFNFRKNT